MKKGLTRKERIGVIAIMLIALAVVGVGVYVRMNPGSLPAGSSEQAIEMEILLNDSIAAEEGEPADDLNGEKKSRHKKGNKKSRKGSGEQGKNKSRKSGRQKGKEAKSGAPRDYLNEEIELAK